MDASRLAETRIFRQHGYICYIYSSNRLLAEPWDAEIKQLAQTLQQQFQVKFNSVLMNYYRDGQDSMGWHADDEVELGKNPLIASLTLGAERVFKLRHLDGETMSVKLASGSLLLMGGSLQHYWKHALPKTTKIHQGRINLTFRKINHRSADGHQNY